jgi:hypothetical protein
MATAVGGNALTLLDAAKRHDPDGKTADIAEILTQQNPILEDMLWLPSNELTGHLTSIRTGLPESFFKKLNMGTPRSKSTTAQVREACAILEARSQVDEMLVNLQNDPSGFRLSESVAFLEAMNQKMATTLFYGNNITTPESFIGLAPRYDDVPTTAGGALNKVNVIDGGGTGSTNTSIWLTVWGENGIYGTYSKNTKAGLVHTDLGVKTVQDDSNNDYEAYLDKYNWHCGLVLKDWRQVGRICNIDVTALVKNAATGADLLDLMTRLKYRIQSLRMGRAVWYVNRTIGAFLERQITNKVSSSTLTMRDIGDSQVMHFAQIPIKVCDALLDTEARVT